MNIGTIPAMPVEAGTTASGSGPSSESAVGFATVLVHTVGGAAAPADSSNAAVVPEILTGSLGQGQWSMVVSEGAAGELAQLIEQLSVYADEDTAEFAPEDKKQYAAAMEQLNALLITLGMIVQVQNHMPNGSIADAQVTNEQSSQGSDPIPADGEQAVPANRQQAALSDAASLLETRDQAHPIPVDRLQAVLVGVASSLDKGDQITRQWFRSTVEPQLATLKQLLVKSEGPHQIQTGTPLTVVQDIPVPLQPTSLTHAGTHLQRMSQLASPPAAWTSSQGAATVEAEEPELAVKADAPQALPVVNLQDQSRWQSQQLRPLVTQPVPVQQLPDTISGMILKQFDVSTVNGTSEARISLFPEHLGQVDIKITIVGGQLTAMFTAEHGMARELLENGMNQLRNALQQQGLQVERLQVTQSDQAQQMFQDQRHQGSGEQPASQQHKSPRAGTAEDSFEDELIQEAASQDLGYGNAINVTA